jgi:hypothetical protein
MSGHAITRPIQQRCWNHESREAVCRCPECGNSFCRECVTEHESRLLCAACLRSLARARQGERAAQRRGIRQLAPVAMALAGIMIAWVVFFAAGEAMLTLAVRAEQTAWQNR